ncbi:ARMADILLO BTB ARABIDOPSIS PROTEIN 1-like isoform X1 [Musa acuminata AAA Group]|uniref:ARMADILLO BTB ARABIDOPSIS PROTEIN 1-like isoform X1 n=2 Tax=Musa acuminata AAA Group TaxID=214697 RepID=UPI0031CFA734
MQPHRWDQLQQRAMVEETEPIAAAVDDCEVAGSAEHWLSRARLLVPVALDKARSAKGFPGRWKSIASKLERVPPCLSDLSSHPCFARHPLCRELVQSVAATLSEAVELADRCRSDDGASVGKLQMQSDLDALSGKLDLSLRDCGLLVKIGVLGDAALPPPSATGAGPAETEFASWNLRELLARLQIGHAEAKHRALDGLLRAMREDEKSVMAVLGRSSVSALVHLMTATSLKVREKAATAVCLLAESGNCEKLLVSEGVLPPLIRILDSGSLVAREKAVISLQRLSMSADTARSIAGHGGIRPLIEVCQVGDSISQTAAAGALKNVSAVPEVRQSLVDEGIIGIMINLLDCGIVLGSKEYAAECLQHLTCSNESLRRSVVSEGGIRSLLAYLEGPLPQESAVGALKNLVGSVSTDTLISLGLLPCLVHVLKDGSLGVQQAAAASICKFSSTAETKRIVGEFGFIPLLVKMLEAKSNGAREVAAQAIASLMTYQHNGREVKKDEKSVPNLVQSLDPSPQNTAKKYAVSCLLSLSSSKKCRKMMISYGAIGYLKKLTDMDVPGAKKLLERLERGRLRSLFSRK